MSKLFGVQDVDRCVNEKQNSDSGKVGKPPSPHLEGKLAAGEAPDGQSGLLLCPEADTEHEIELMSLVEAYISTLKYSGEVTDHEKTLVTGNVRGFFCYLRDNGLLNTRYSQLSEGECPECKFMDTVDICDKCDKDFGLSGEDGNGHNSTCVHCGNNTYTTQPCKSAVHASDTVNNEKESTETRCTKVYCPLDPGHKEPCLYAKEIEV